MGKRKYQREHRRDGVWILGMVEITPERKIIMIPVDKRDSDTLKNLISKHVCKGSIIHTDMWRGYNGLSETGYTHRVVNHSLFFKDPETGISTNVIEGNWSGLKIRVPKRYRTRSLIWFYLLTFMYKRNIKQDLINYILKFI